MASEWAFHIHHIFPSEVYGITDIGTMLTALGFGQQAQGSIRPDEDPNFMALILLGIYAQAMLSVLAGRPFDAEEISRVVRVVVEGVGRQAGVKMGISPAVASRLVISARNCQSAPYTWPDRAIN